MTCPCGTSKPFSDCCQPLIDGKKQAATPEELMRSRYTAFALKNMDYVLQTNDPQTRMQVDMAANMEWAETANFQKLEILASSQDGNKGAVEFKATYQTKDGETHVHHEFSKFRKQAGVWYFRDGRTKPEAKASSFK